MKSSFFSTLTATVLIAFTALPALQDAPVIQTPSELPAITASENSTPAPFQIAIPTWRLMCSLNYHMGCQIRIDPATGREYCDCAVGVGDGGG